MHDTGAQALRDFNRLVGRSVVADNHLASDAATGEGFLRLLDADAERQLFIEAGDDCRDEDGRRVGLGPHPRH